MQNSATNPRRWIGGSMPSAAATKKGRNEVAVAAAAAQHTDYMSDTDDEDEDSEVESFQMEQELDDDSMFETPKYLLSAEGSDSPDLQNVDPETQARLEALLEAAGIGKLSTPDGKHFADPEVLRKLTSSVSCALDEAAAALSRMRAESAGQLGQTEATLAEACSDGDAPTVRKLLEEGRSVNETTEEGDSLLSLACQAGYYELAQVLLAMRANVEDRGIKGDCTPLMEAASAGHADIVKLLISHNADVNSQSSSGNTPLMYGCAGGHGDVVKALLSAQANVEDHNENGHTPLMEAASAGHVNVAKILLDHGAGVNTHSNEFKESALTLACYKGHLEMVRFLLDAGADQEHKTDEMHTALMEASMDGHVEVARLLLDSGAQVNMPADSFESPLTLAACGGHVELAMLLLERNANIEEVNDEGYTPLMEAAREGHEEMVALLLSQGADINAQTEETQETALTLACCGGFLEVSDFLIKAGADIELGASTPLMEAAQEGRLELVKYLLNAGSNVHACTQTGDTALTYACENGHTDVADLLLQSSADLEHESEGGRTPLMKAARAGHVCTVQFLISRGADVNRHTTNNDHTALSLACAGGHLVVVELLIANGADPTHKLKDNSTMLIEASKGGHTAIVQMLLDYPNNMAAAAAAAAANAASLSDVTPVTTPTYSELVPEAHRVPPHGVPLLVPLDSSPGVTQTYYHNPQSSAAGVVTTKQDCAKRTQPLPLPQPIQPQPQQQASVMESALTTAELQQVKNAPVAAHLAPGFPPDFNYDFQGPVAGGVVDVAEEVTLELDRDSRPCERLEACINNMMKKAEQLHHNREEQILQKQQILEELQRVERELQEKAQAQLLLNAQQQQASSLHHHHHHSMHPHHHPADPLTSSCAMTVPLPVATASGATQPSNGALSEYAMGMAVGINVIRNFSNEKTTPEAAALAAATDMAAAAMAGSSPTGLPYFLVEGALDLPPGTVSLQPLPPTAGDKPKAKPAASSTTTPAASGAPLSKKEAKAAQVDTARLQHFKLQQRQQQQLQLAEESEKLNVAAAGEKRPDVLPVVPITVDPVASRMSGEAPAHRQHHQVQSQDSAVVSVGMGHHLCPNQAAGAAAAPLSPPLQLMATQGMTAASLAAATEDGSSQDAHLKSITTMKNQLNTSTGSNCSMVGNIPLNATDALPQQPGSQPAQPHCVPTSTVATQYIDPSLPVAVPLPAWSTAPAAMATLQQVTAAQAAAAAAAAAAKRQQMDEDSAEEGSGADKEGGAEKVVAPVLPPPLIDVNSQTDSNHDTALTLACAGGHEELVQLLLARGADIEHRDKKGFTPLILAATAGHANVVEMLLNHGADIEAQSERTKDTPLSLACSGGRFEVVEILLARGSNKEHRNVSDYTPLSLAASGGYVNIIKLLLNHGAEINSRTGSKLGISPLMLAAMNGHATAVKLLLDMGSDINAQIETNRNTALTLACFQGRHEVVSLLVDRKANVEHRAKTGLTPLMEAASGGYIEVGRVLLERGADVNAPPVPSSRDTALTIAADKGHIRFVELLLKSGAQVDVKNKKGNSPMWLAANGGHLDVLQLLATSDADIDSQDNRKVSCLMAAFRKGHMKVVKWMVRNVSQFPSDQEMTRYISTFNDEELLSRCEQCLEMIRIAKERQAVEANKYANILLEELDMEKNREETKKAAAARRRERKRQKKKVKSDKKDVSDENVKSKSSLRELARVMHMDSATSDMSTAIGTVPLLGMRNLKLSDVFSSKPHNISSSTPLPSTARLIKPPSLGVPYGTPSASNANTTAPAASASSALAAVTTARTTTEEAPPTASNSRSARDRILQLQSSLPPEACGNAAIATYLSKYEGSGSSSKRAGTASGVCVAGTDKPVRERGAGRMRLDKEARRERKSMAEAKSAAAVTRTGVTIKVGILPDRSGAVDKVSLVTSRQQPMKERATGTNTAISLLAAAAASTTASNTTATTKKASTFTLPSFAAASTSAASLVPVAPSVVAPVAHPPPTTVAEQPRKANQRSSTQQLAHNFLFGSGQSATSTAAEEQQHGAGAGTTTVTYAASSTGTTNRTSGKGGGGNKKLEPAVSVLSSARSPPSLSNSLKTPTVATSSPKRGGSKRDEAGWKEVVRKTGSLSVRSKKVLVPSNAISRVIGRGGCNINTIREVSGAVIEVEKQKGAGDRAIVIRGSAESTKHAHQLITQMIKDPDRDLSDLLPAKSAAANSKSSSMIKLANYLHGGAANQASGVLTGTQAKSSAVMSSFLKSGGSLHPSGVISNMAFPSSNPPFSAQLRQQAAAAVRPGGIAMSPAFSSQTPSWPPFPVPVTLTTTGGKKGANSGLPSIEGGGSPTANPLASVDPLASIAAKSPAARQLFPVDKKTSQPASNKTAVSYTTAVLGNGKAVTLAGNDAPGTKIDNRPTAAALSVPFSIGQGGAKSGGVKSGSEGTSVVNQEAAATLASTTAPSSTRGSAMSSTDGVAAAASASSSIFASSSATTTSATSISQHATSTTTVNSPTQPAVPPTMPQQQAQQRNPTPPYRVTPPPPPQQSPPPAPRSAPPQEYSPFNSIFSKVAQQSVWGKEKQGGGQGSGQGGGNKGMNFASVAAGNIKPSSSQITTTTNAALGASPVEDEPSPHHPPVDAAKAPGYRGNVSSSSATSSVAGSSSLISPNTSLCVGTGPNSGPISPGGRPGMPSSAPSTPPIGPIAPPPGSSLRKASPPMVSGGAEVNLSSSAPAAACFSAASLSSMGNNPSVAMQYSMAAPHMAPIAPPSHGSHRVDVSMAGLDLSTGYGPPRLSQQQQHSPSQNYHQHAPHQSQHQQQQQMLHQLQQQHHHHQQQQQQQHQQQLEMANSYQQQQNAGGSSGVHSNLNPNAPDFSSSRSAMLAASAAGGNPNQQQHPGNMSQQQQMHMNRLSGMQENQVYQHHQQQQQQHQQSVNVSNFSGPGVPNLVSMVSSAPPSVGTTNNGGGGGSAVSQMAAAATSQAAAVAAGLRLSYQQASLSQQQQQQQASGGGPPHANEYPPHLTRGNVNVNKIMTDSENQRLMRNLLMSTHPSMPGSLGPVGPAGANIKHLAQFQALMAAQRAGNPNHHIISGPSKDDNVHISPVSSPHPGSASPTSLAGVIEYVNRGIAEDRKLPRPIGTERAHRKGYNINDYSWRGSYGSPKLPNEQMPDERLSAMQPNYVAHYVDSFGGRSKGSILPEPDYQLLAPGPHSSGMNSNYPTFMNGIVNQQLMMTPMYVNQQPQASAADIWRANNSGMNMMEAGGGGPNDVGVPPLSMGMAPGQQQASMMGPGSGPGPQQPGSEPKVWNTWSHTQM